MNIKNLYRSDVIRLDVNDPTYTTDEGYLIDHPIVTRIGIFEYHDSKTGRVRKEFRPPEEVFDPVSLESYAGKPVIITHDAGFVSSKNVTDEEIGTMLEPGYKDGDNVRVKLVIHDTESMKESGLRELSLGYNLDLDETPGEYNGEHYDAVQRNIRINHLALVAEARAGEKARLNIDSKDSDTLSISKEGGFAMTPEEFSKKIEAFSEEDAPEVPDPKEVQEQIQDEDEPTLAEKIQDIRDRHDCHKDGEDPEDLEAANKLIADQAADIQTLLDCIDSMEAERDLTQADGEDEPEENEDEDEENEEGGDLNKDSVDRIVRERLAVLRIGDKLQMDGLEDMSVIAAKKAIIKKVTPNVRLDGRSKTYINAAYDYTVENLIENRNKGSKLQRMQMMGQLNTDSADRNVGLTEAQAARERMLAEREGGNA